MLEDFKVKPDEIDEVVNEIDEVVNVIRSREVNVLDSGINKNSQILELQNMIDNEEDWKKKAKFAARIISEKFGDI